MHRGRVEARRERRQTHVRGAAPKRGQEREEGLRQGRRGHRQHGQRQGADVVRERQREAQEGHAGGHQGGRQDPAHPQAPAHRMRRGRLQVPLRQGAPSGKLTRHGRGRHIRPVRRGAIPRPRSHEQHDPKVTQPRVQRGFPLSNPARQSRARRRRQG